MERIEQTILRNLIFNEEYCRKVLPFIRNEYFDTRTDRILFEEISSFLDKFNTLPTKEVLSIETDSREDITGDEMKIISDLIQSLDDAPVEQDWLEKYTEKWCRDRAIYLALMESIKIAASAPSRPAPRAATSRRSPSRRPWAPGSVSTPVASVPTRTEAVGVAPASR